MSRALCPKFSYSAAQLRQLVSDQVQRLSDVEFQGLLDTYRREVSNREFLGGWDPVRSRSRHDLCRAITLPNRTGNGYDFQGDSVTLDLLSKALHINIAVFHKDRQFRFCFDHPTFQHTVMVLYHAKGSFAHYQLLGVPWPETSSRSDGLRIQTLFPARTIRDTNFFAHGTTQAALSRGKKEDDRVGQ